jgi:hypothetical protein
VDPHHVDAYHPDADPDSELLFDADPDPTFHPDADPDPDHSLKKGTNPFYFMRMLIQVTKMTRIRIRIYNTAAFFSA